MWYVMTFILSSLITVNGIDYHFQVLIAVNGITIMVQTQMGKRGGHGGSHVTNTGEGVKDKDYLGWGSGLGYYWTVYTFINDNHICCETDGG